MMLCHVLSIYASGIQCTVKAYLGHLPWKVISRLERIEQQLERPNAQWLLAKVQLFTHHQSPCYIVGLVNFLHIFQLLKCFQVMIDSYINTEWHQWRSPWIILDLPNPSIYIIDPCIKLHLPCSKFTWRSLHLPIPPGKCHITCRDGCQKGGSWDP